MTWKLSSGDESSEQTRKYVHTKSSNVWIRWRKKSTSEPPLMHTVRLTLARSLALTSNNALTHNREREKEIRIAEHWKQNGHNEPPALLLMLLILILIHKHIFILHDFHICISNQTKPNRRPCTRVECRQTAEFLSLNAMNYSNVYLSISGCGVIWLATKSIALRRSFAVCCFYDSPNNHKRSGCVSCVICWRLFANGNHNLQL